jgi:D-aminopeptidase
MTEATKSKGGADAVPHNTSAGLAALDAMFQPFARSDAPGLVVGVAHNGKTIYRAGFGLASIELGVANTAWTRMRIGSSSKHFTCLAALLLAEDGKLDVDADVRRYIPELPESPAKVTLRHLMTHTSGLRCYLDLGLVAGGMSTQPKGSALAAQIRQTEVNFDLGEKMMYCNSGYHLLSITIERVSGMPFERFLAQRIFAPLGMRDTCSVPSDFEIHRGMATLHMPQIDGSWRRGIFPSEEVRGEGAMVSTLDDMLVWLAHLRDENKLVGAPQTWREILSPARLNNGIVSKYALGLIRDEYRGLEVLHHAGGVFGGACQLLTVPSQALDIVIMTNGALVNPTELSFRIIDVIASTALTAPPIPRPKAERFKHMLGVRYCSPRLGVGFSFTEAPEGALGLSFMNFMPAPMKETDGGEGIALGFEDIAVGPLMIQAAEMLKGDEAPKVLTLSESGHPEQFDRAPSTPPPVAQAGIELIGRYHSADLAADANLRFDGEKLQLEILGRHGSHTLELEPWCADLFAWKSTIAYLPLRGLLSIDRDLSGSVQGFRLDSMRTRRLRFERLVRS